MPKRAEQNVGVEIGKFEGQFSSFDGALSGASCGGQPCKLSFRNSPREKNRPLKVTIRTAYNSGLSQLYRTLLRSKGLCDCNKPTQNIEANPRALHNKSFVWSSTVGSLEAGSFATGSLASGSAVVNHSGGALPACDHESLREELWQVLQQMSSPRASVRPSSGWPSDWSGGAPQAPCCVIGASPPQPLRAP